MTGFSESGIPCSDQCSHGGFDLIIFDVKDGNEVKGISCGPQDVPSWNIYNVQDVETLFEYSEMFLKKDGCIFVFVLDVSSIRGDIATYAKRYSFTTHREWFMINDLPSVSYLDRDVQVCEHYYCRSFVDPCL